VPYYQRFGFEVTGEIERRPEPLANVAITQVTGKDPSGAWEMHHIPARVHQM
jgi:hypothetical protein